MYIQDYLIQNKANETFVMGIFMMLNGGDEKRSIKDTEHYYSEYMRIEGQKERYSMCKKQFVRLGRHGGENWKP